MALPDVSYPRAVLVALMVSTAVGLAVAAGTSGTTFGPYNQGWAGTSDLRAVAADVDTPATVADSTATYRTTPADGTVAVVVLPRQSRDGTDPASLRRFVAAGGTLVVPGEPGSAANGLLDTVGADARLDGRPLRDDTARFRSPAMPVARNVSDHPETAGVDALTLNHGTVVEPRGGTVLASTSEFAYLDANRNGSIDVAEPIGPFPVATVEAVGGGRVVVVADASPFINVMLERPGNRAFAATLFRTHDRAIIDTTRAAELPPLARAVLVLRRSPWLQVLAGLVTVALIAAWGLRPVDRVVARLPGDRSAPMPGTDASALADAVAREHPDWDEKRVRRVVSGAAGTPDTRDYTPAGEERRDG